MFIIFLPIELFRDVAAVFLLWVLFHGMAIGPRRGGMAIDLFCSVDQVDRFG